MGHELFSLWHSLNFFGCSMFPMGFMVMVLIMIFCCGCLGDHGALWNLVIVPCFLFLLGLVSIMVFCSGYRCVVKHFMEEGCFSIGLWVVSLLPLAYTSRLVGIVGIWHIERDVFPCDSVLQIGFVHICFLFELVFST